MSQRPYNLAIETSGRSGAVALGCGDELLATEMLAAGRRHDIGLMPTIDALCRSHHLRPRQLGEVYVSLGPGSFTGLRVGMAAAKMLALSLDVNLVGVPTLDVLAGNAPAEYEHVAVCLNSKRGTVYCAVYHREADAAHCVRVAPALRTMDELLRVAPRPLSIIAEKLPDTALPDDVIVLPASQAVAQPGVLWRLGRALAQRGQFTPAATLLPLYVREPEAVTLWNQRLAQSQA